MNRSFKFFWTTHKWIGIVLTALFALTAVTGFLLLIKKDHDWIMPPTFAGQPGGIADFIDNQRLFHVVLGTGHADFRRFEDIDRIDFRPHDAVFKVQSRHSNTEIQVDAVTGRVLNTGVRRSDLLESLHDGSWFGDWAHGWVMPVVPVAMLFLSLSGLWLWVSPIVRRRRIRRHRRRETVRRS